MPVLFAVLELAGLRAQCSEASYSFDQGTDYVGCPNTTVHVGLLKVVLTGEVAASPVWEELMFDPYRRESGHLIFFQGEDQTFKRITFYNAACVFYKCRFDARGRDGQGSFETELRFSAATLDAQGQRVDAHSIIPWVTDAATSRRALTKPPEPAPWLGLVGNPFGLPKLPPIPLGPEPEKNFIKDHPTVPPDPNASHLAELERAREVGTLTPDEEAEYVALLAKERGVDDTTPEKVPHGFSSVEQFEQAGKELKSALAESGIKYSEIGVEEAQ